MIVVDQAYIERVAQATFDEVMTFFQPNCCVIASRIVLGVLGTLGIDAYPLAVHAVVTRPGIPTAVVLGDRTPHPDAPHGPAPRPMRVGLGTSWDGHMGIVADRRWMVDVTISQARVIEPAFPIDGPVVFAVRPSWLHGREGAALTDLDSGMLIQYLALPLADPADWQNDLDWQPTSTVLELIRTSLARLQDEPVVYQHRGLIAARALLGRV